MGGKDSKETRAEANFVNVNYFPFLQFLYVLFNFICCFFWDGETKGDRF